MWKTTATPLFSNELQHLSRSGWEKGRPSTGPIGTIAADTPAAEREAS